ncbi:MAG TPA: phage holin family protein [Bacteroidales bacterium]|nr:phage holin family protein [Bacteroidales bacterium]HPT02643.1 phage holin family protein [Bacteroidales bacterium]
MKFILRILVSSLAVFFAAYLLKGVHLNGFPTAVLLAIVLGLLNAFLKPLLVLMTIPFTVFSFGLFLLVINAFIILIADKLLAGFAVDGFMTALIFSIIVTLTTWILETLAGEKKES